MAAISMGVIAGVGALSNVIGGKKASKSARRQAQIAAWMLSPEQVQKRMQKDNPQLHNAAYGPNPFEQWQTPTDNYGDWADQQSAMRFAYQNDPMSALFNAPGYINPQMMNQSLTQNARQESSRMDEMVSLMGRNAAMGGMANAFAMANSAAAQTGRSNIFRNYDQMRINKTSSDMAQGQNMLNTGLNAAFNAQGGQGQMIANMPIGQNDWQGAGQLISGGLGAWGAFQQMNQPQQQQAGGYRSYQPGQTPNTVNPGSLTQQMNYNPMPQPNYGTSNAWG